MNKVTWIESEDTEEEKESMRTLYNAQRDTVQKRVKKLNMDIAFAFISLLFLIYGAVMLVVSENAVAYAGVYFGLFIAIVGFGLWADFSVKSRRDAIEELKVIEAELMLYS